MVTMVVVVVVFPSEVLSVSVDGFAVVFFSFSFFLSFLLFPPPVFLLFEVLMLKSGKRPEATLLSPGVT